MRLILFENKYRISSTRLSAWDYREAGYYFITICVEGRYECLSRIVNRRIILLPAGEIVKKEWMRTPILRKNILLDYYTIMPNHFHGIIIITDNSYTETSHRDVSTLLPNSIGSIIGQFKSITTKQIRKNYLHTFSWQTRYYDHIIRSEKSLFAIREYIQYNHLKWEIDVENPAYNT